MIRKDFVTRLHSRALAALVLTACAGHQIPPTAQFEAGDPQAAIEAQKVRAAEDSRDRTLEELRLASMAYAAGDAALAEQALRSAVAAMTTFQADGEFAATIGAEANKEWKGEPYEKMAAFLTLGMLLYAKGDSGNALAMFKSAALADTGTAEERYRSDFVPAWVLQALVFDAVREPGNAEQSLGRAIDALWSRHTVDRLESALLHTDVSADATKIQAGKALLVAALSGGVAAFPRDANEAVRATISQASSLLLEQRQKAKDDRLADLQNFRDSDFDDAAEVLPMLSDAWRTAVAALPAADDADLLQTQAALEALHTTPPNTVLVIERGHGPRKVRTGDYGEVLSIVRVGPDEGAPIVEIDDAAQTPLLLDDLTWQAQTRGGRQVDGFLKGKAIYKTSSLIGGYVLLRAAEGVSYGRNDQLAGALAIAGAVLFISGAATNPAADIRQWELLPNEWYLVTANLAPGPHRLLADGVVHTIEVPATGQAVALLPHLAPFGPTTLGAPTE